MAPCEGAFGQLLGACTSRLCCHHTSALARTRPLVIVSVCLRHGAFGRAYGLSFPLRANSGYRRCQARALNYLQPGPSVREDVMVMRWRVAETIFIHAWCRVAPPVLEILRSGLDRSSLLVSSRTACCGSQGNQMSLLDPLRHNALWFPEDRADVPLLKANPRWIPWMHGG